MPLWTLLHFINFVVMCRPWLHVACSTCKAFLRHWIYGICDIQSQNH